MFMQEQQPTQVLENLRQVIQTFLDQHDRISLNGLSKKCQVSEPTLRRIMSGKVKTMPTLTTIVDILATISKENRLPELIKQYPGPIAEVLKEGFSLVNDEELPYQFSAELNEVLRDEQRYLIFKLAANSSGVRRDRVKELFGLLGEQKLDDLIARDLVYEKLVDQQRVAFTRIEGFSLSHELFISHFKAVANYIDTSARPGNKNNLYYNFSESVNETGRREILNIQRQALKKIIAILNDEKYRGELPLFVLSAIDTLEPHLEGPVTLQ
jgi:transcriptional regulator with XRE-family HTH domain